MFGEPCRRIHRVPARCTLSTLRLTVEAHPNARVRHLELVDTTLRVWVRARAVERQANEAIKQAIAEGLGLRNHQVQMLSGTRSRHKVFEIDVADISELRRRLTQSSGT
jgi:uncharacterized protein YggU (UPF0235/DUF167 family)